MASLSPDIQSKIARDPNAPLNLIVRVDTSPSAHLDDLKKLGFTVKRSFTLTPSVAIQGAASAAQDLARQPWVVSIEEDKPVHTL